MEEIWKNIDPEGIYKISNFGRVKTTFRRGSSGGFMKPSVGRKGYLQIDLRYGGKRHYCKIHRLVAEAFIPNPDNLPEINHKDEDKTNNRVDNLEWCTHWYNVHYGTGAERGREPLKKNFNQYDYDGNLIAEWRGMNVVARDKSIDPSCIIRCCQGLVRTYQGSIWLYADDPNLSESLRERVEWVNAKNHYRYGKKMPIRQYDLSGNLVREYASTREAIRETNVPHYILFTKLKEGGSIYHSGYIWSKS